MAVAVRDAVATQGLRGLSRATGLTAPTLANLRDGLVWPTLATQTAVERALHRPVAGYYELVEQAAAATAAPSAA